MQGMVAGMNNPVFDIVKPTVYTGQCLQDGPVDSLAIFRVNAL